MQVLVKEGQILKKSYIRINENKRNSSETKVQPFSDDFANICRFEFDMKNGSTTQRIHSLRNLQKKAQYILTPHKQKKLVALPCKLPAIGCTEKKARISLKFPPQRIKKIF